MLNKGALYQQSHPMMGSQGGIPSLMAQPPSSSDYHHLPLLHLPTPLHPLILPPVRCMVPPPPSQPLHTLKPSHAPSRCTPPTAHVLRIFLCQPSPTPSLASTITTTTTTTVPPQQQQQPQHAPQQPQQLSGLGARTAPEADEAKGAGITTAPAAPGRGRGRYGGGVLWGGQAIQNIIVQIFYNVHVSDPDKSDSLRKVLKIWEAQKYFDDVILKQIKDIISMSVEELTAAAQATPVSSGDSNGSQPWQQAQATPPPWAQKGQSRWGPSSPGRAVGGAGDQPTPWSQPSQPKPLFPVSRPEEPPPPPPPRRNSKDPSPQAVEGEMGRGSGGRADDWREREEGSRDAAAMYRGEASESGGRYPSSAEPSSSHPSDPPRPGAREGCGIPDDDDDVDPVESYDYNHRSIQPPPSSDGGEEGQGPVKVFDYNHQSVGRSHDEPKPSDHSRNRWDQGLHDGMKHPSRHPPEEWGPSSDLPPPSLGDRPPPKRWGEGPPPSHHGPPESWPPHHPPPHPHDAWGPPPPHHMHHGPPMPPPPGPPMWERPPFPPPGPPMGPPWDGPGPPPHGDWMPPGPPPGPPPPPPIPYFDLPAGIMVSLVPPHEHSYRPLRPHDVVLPAPSPPTDHLLKAVDEFYEEDTENKRNDEGWEARALLGYFESKRRAKENITRQIRSARRPPPVRRRRSPSPRRRRRSYSSSSSSRSRSRSRSRSHSRSPRSKRKASSRSPSTDRSRSRSDSRSPSPARRRRRRSQSRSRSPFIPTVRSPPRAKKSLSPEEDEGRPSFAVSKTQDTKLEEDNMGHQLLKRMGWGGAGLGAQQQGIEEPIKSGDVRGKIDKYKGVGMDMKDPFEMFRKNMSYTFNRRERPPK